MIFKKYLFKKYYERKAELQAEVEKLETEIEELEAKREAIKAENIHYENELHENKHLREYEKMYMEKAVLNKYRYAVLLPEDDYKLVVWNQGKYENGITYVEVGQEAGSIPHFRLEK